MDALHITKETIHTVVDDKQGHILVGVKNNRKNLKTAVLQSFENASTESILRDVDIDKGHGRIEERILEIVPITPEKAGYPHIHSAMKIYRKREHLRQGKIFKTDEEVSYYVSSLQAEQMGAKQAAKMIRGHWSIENRLHHSKDVSYNEDQYRAKGGFARIMTAIRSFATILFKSCSMTLPTAQMRFVSKPALIAKILRCKSLDSFRLQFLG